MLKKSPLWIQVFGLSFVLSSCDLNTNVSGICFEQPSDPRCVSIENEYESLRNTSIVDRKLRRRDKDRIVAEFAQLSDQFSNLSEKSKNLNYCISIAAKSYSNYLNVMLSSKKSSKNIRDIYPKNTSNNIDLISLNCSWSLGEGSFILADYVLSNSYNLGNSDDLWNLIVKLNDNAIDNSTACLLLLEKPLHPFPKKHPEPSSVTGIMIEQLSKCKLNYKSFSEDVIDLYLDEISEIIKNDYSTLDKELSHSAIFRE